MKQWFKYEFGFVNLDSENFYLTNSGNWSETENLKEKTKALLHRLEIDANPNLSARIMERLAAMNKDDIHLAHGF